MPPDDLLEAANARGSALSKTLGYRLVAWEKDRAVVRYDIDAAHANRHGNLHGGVVATVMDAAGGYCGTWSPPGAPPLHSVTLSLTVEYIASSAGKVLFVEARRTGGGKSIYFIQAEARDENGVLLATGSGTFKFVRREGL
jgi:uncharacterized protein (TIGR00369 family)